MDGIYNEVEGTAITSPVDAPNDTRAKEAGEAESWFKSLTGEVFG